jgi:hypothetical protein
MLIFFFFFQDLAYLYFIEIIILIVKPFKPNTQTIDIQIIQN